MAGPLFCGFLRLMSHEKVVFHAPSKESDLM